MHFLLIILYGFISYCIVICCISIFISIEEYNQIVWLTTKEKEVEEENKNKLLIKKGLSCNKKGRFNKNISISSPLLSLSTTKTIPSSPITTTTTTTNTMMTTTIPVSKKEDENECILIIDKCSNNNQSSDRISIYYNISMNIIDNIKILLFYMNEIPFIMNSHNHYYRQQHQESDHSIV
jgi:hypothetical protein